MTFLKTKNRRLESLVVSETDFFVPLDCYFYTGVLCILNTHSLPPWSRGRVGPPEPGGVFNSLVLTMIEHSNLRNDIREGFVQFSFCSNFIIKMYLGIDKSSKELSAELRGETE